MVDSSTSSHIFSKAGMLLAEQVVAFALLGWGARPHEEFSVFWILFGCLHFWENAGIWKKWKSWRVARLRKVVDKRPAGASADIPGLENVTSLLEVKSGFLCQSLRTKRDLFWSILEGQWFCDLRTFQFRLKLLGTWGHFMFGIPRNSRREL